MRQSRRGRELENLASTVESSETGSLHMYAAETEHSTVFLKQFGDPQGRAQPHLKPLHALDAQSTRSKNEM